MNKQDLEQLTLFQEDSPANHFPWLESKKVKGTIVTSGRKCFGLSENLSRVGLSVRTYLESSRLPGKQFARTWSVKDTLSPFLILKLRLSVRRTEGTEFSFWRTPDAHCDRGASSAERMKMKIEKGMPISLNDQIAHPELMWPTPNSSDQYYPNLPHDIGRNYLRADILPNKNISSSEARITGTLNPTWVEWLQGFPINYTEVD